MGRSYAALSAATLLAGIGQLNLADVLVRFAPAAGRHTRKLALGCYAASAGFSTAVAVLFLILVPLLSRDWTTCAARWRPSPLSSAPPGTRSSSSRTGCSPGCGDRAGC
ncbi:hypothetical protein GXW82_05250 [Streptacidiphilus sp. 4-A2]|nr:hypothetical protein [Streptacidiphilus sp. 4-A2]